MIETLIQRIKSHKPSTIDDDLPEAGILVPVTRNSNDPKIILTRRAEHMNTHRGQVAFPGGKFDDEDDNIQQTALRECHEEIGVEPRQVEIIGPLSQAISLHGIRVSPFVGLVDEDTDLTPNFDELDSIFQVPVSFFKDATPKRRDKTTFRDMALSIPSYEYSYNGQTYEIWGLTSIVLIELVNVAYDFKIPVFENEVD